MGGFRGDLSTLGLADIFQTLSNSQKEGTLVVGDGESRKCIYFGKEGLSLLSLGSRKGLRIGDILQKGGKISPDQLRDLLAAQKGSGKKLGELVVERGIATEEEISEAIRTQIEDEIFDLFNWKKASFEFIDGPPAPELNDADKPVTSLKFDVNSLLFEASRRIDEWSLINQAIPNPSTIFILTEAGEEIIKNSEDHSIAGIGALTDGSRTVDQIVEESGLSRFAACKGLYTFLTQNGIRPVSQDELVAMGKRLAYQGDSERAIRTLTCAVEIDRENLGPQQELALVLRQAGMADKAHARYLEMGQLWEKRGRAGEALQSYKQARECKPDDGESAYYLFRLLHTTQAGGDALKLGDQLFPALTAAGDRARALEVGEILATYRASDLDLRLRLAALAQDAGDQATCGRHLAAAIDHLPPGSGDAENLARKVLQVLPNRTDIRFKVERIFAERRARSKKRMTRTAGIAGVLALVALGGIYGWYETQARKAWVDIQREAEALIVQKNWEKASQKFAEIKSRFPGSLISRAATGRMAEVEKLKQADTEEAIRKAEEAKKKDREEEEAQFARLAEAKGMEAGPAPAAPRLTDARRVYQEVIAWAEERGKTVLLEDAKKGFSRVDEYLRRAEGVAEAAARHLKDNEVEAAHTRVRELLTKYPKSPQALSAELPYQVTSVPPQAQVYLGSKMLGLTPLVIKARPDAEMEILVKLRTFKEARKALTIGNPTVAVEMVKDILWRRKTDAEIETSPVVEGGRILVGSMDKRLYCIDAANYDSPPWKPFETSAAGQIQSSPAVLDGRVYFGANDNIFYCLDALKGTKLWSQSLPGAVKGSPAFSPDGALVLVGSEDGQLSAFDAVKGGPPRWQARAGKAVRGRAWCSKDRAYFGSMDNKVRAVDLATGAQRWETPTGGPIWGPVSAWNQHLVVGSEDGVLYVIGLDGEIKWKYKTDKGITGGACISGDVAYFGNTGALFAVDLDQRREAWSSPFLLSSQQPVRGTPVVGDDAVYFGAEDGVLYAVEMKTGGLRWKYATGGPIVGSPCLAGNGKNYIFIGSGDHYLYALER